MAASFVTCFGWYGFGISRGRFSGIRLGWVRFMRVPGGLEAEMRANEAALRDAADMLIIARTNAERSAIAHLAAIEERDMERLRIRRLQDNRDYWVGRRA